MAVAESISDLSEALKGLIEAYWRNKNDESGGFIVCITPEGIPDYFKAADKALKKARGE